MEEAEALGQSIQQEGPRIVLVPRHFLSPPSMERRK